MILAFPDNPRYSIPFSIGVGESNAGSRLGGRAPAHILSLNLRKGVYFATVPISVSPSMDASIFLDWERFVTFDNVPVNCVTTAGRRFVEVVADEPAKRAADFLFAGPLSEHPLVFGSVTEDTEVDFDDGRCSRSSHKLGGCPHLIQPRESLIDQIKAIQSAGYRQVVQFDYIAPNDAAWKGSWPFGDGLFQVFGRPPFKGSDWVWLWQY